MGVVTLTGASHSSANSEPKSGRRARTLPNFERCGSKLFVYGPFEEMALVVEGVRGRECPALDRFVRNIYPSLSQQILDIPEAQGKRKYSQTACCMITGGKSVSGIGDFLHPATLLRRQRQVTLFVKQPLPSPRARRLHRRAGT